MASGWGGRRAQAWTAAVLANGRDDDGLVRCALKLDGCTTYATTGDHIESRYHRPDLQYVVANGQPACLHCNTSRGKRDISSLQSTIVRPTIDNRAFFDDRPPGSPAPSFLFLPE